MQDYLDHLFLEVWCKADARVPYDVTLLHPELQAIINEIFYDADVPHGRYLYEPIGDVYEIFQLLDVGSKSTMAWAYVLNNSIESLCSNELGYYAVTYDDLKVYHPLLPEVLKDFYENLYNKVLGLKAVSRRIGELGDHYTEFVTVNDEGKCPYCGINSIKGIYQEKREAYDHYLPKGTYPFNSVNFRNLAPMCHECNSSYKLAKDPINARPKKNPLKNNLGTQRKAFYSYTPAIETINLQVAFTSNDIQNLTPDDIIVTFNNPAIVAEIDTWVDVFGIEERYKAKCLEKNEGKYWYEQATDEFENVQADLGAGFTRAQWVQSLINAANRKPYAQGNFIKARYLEACIRVGAL